MKKILIIVLVAVVLFTVVFVVGARDIGPDEPIPTIDEVCFSVTNYWPFDEAGNIAPHNGQADSDPYHTAGMIDVSADRDGDWVAGPLPLLVTGASIVLPGFPDPLPVWDTFGDDVYQAGVFWHSGYGRWVIGVDVFTATKGKPCRNCGEDNRSGSNGLCGKCYRYWYRHGVDRPDNMRHPFYINIPMTEIDELYDRYCNGESIDSLGDEAPFSAETLRRRFREYGLPIRKNTAHNQKFTEATVLQARQLHYEDGWMISEVARYLGIKYQTVYEAVKFTTWSHVGGPGRDEPGDPVPCSCCGVLTGHHSGLCRFCLDEK